MRIYTSRWANQDLAHLDCQPVGISRGTPRWRTPYRWKKLMKLAPSRETFVLTGCEAFEQSYLEQLEALGAEEIMANLRRISSECGGKPLVMLCWEPSGEFCHRRLLATFIQGRTGIVVPELKAGELPRRPDSPQPRLFDSYRDGYREE